MPKLSVRIETVFRDLPFVERIAAVRAAGLEAVEFGEWRDKDLDTIRAACEEHGVRVAAFAVDTGGPLTTGGDIDALMTGVAESLDAAEKLGAKVLLCTAGDDQPGRSRAAQHEMIVAKLQAAAPLLEDAGVTAALGPLTSEEGVRIVDEVGSPNVKLLIVVNSQQDALRNLTGNLDRVEHVHATVERDYTVLLGALDRAGYAGYVGVGSVGKSAGLKA